MSFFQTAILLSDLPFEIVGKAVEIEHLYEAVDLTLSLQVHIKNLDVAKTYFYQTLYSM